MRGFSTPLPRQLPTSRRWASYATTSRLILRTSWKTNQAKYSYACQYFSSLHSASQQPEGSARLPLKGITVVSIEQAIAAPFCTRQLADLGARVIKIERPDTGDFARHYDARVNGLCSHFVWTNRSKESLAIDVKTSKGLEILHKVISKADVFVQNLVPGASARLGLSYSELKDKHPRLIVCDISGYGQDGPYSQKKAYDLLIQSEAGVLSVTGTETEPAKVGIPVADISAGMYAYSNILVALLQRQKTGKGAKIDISMLEGIAEWMSFPLYYTFNGAPAPKPAGASHAAIFPYGPFETKGGSVMLGIQNEREWLNFCRIVLGNEDLARDERFKDNSCRMENRSELRQIIYDVFSRHTSNEVIAKLDEASIANAAVNNMQQVWQHPQLKARKRWTEVETSGGTIPALLPPGIVPSEVSDGGLSSRMGKIPEVGEHNELILAELGLDEGSNQSRHVDGGPGV